MKVSDNTGMRKFLAAAAIAIVGCSPAAVAVELAPPVAIVCQEDMECWDCETMGNKVCGESNIIANNFRGEHERSLLRATAARFSHETDVVRDVAATVPDATPDAEFRGIVFVDGLRNRDGEPVPGLERGGLILMDSHWMNNPTKLVLHELSHLVTPGDGHGKAWCEVFFGSVQEVIPEQYESIARHTRAWYAESCEGL